MFNLKGKVFKLIKKWDLAITGFNPVFVDSIT